MRKILSLLLCVAMLCSLVVITAQADVAPAPSFTDVYVLPEGEVTIDMNLTYNPGLAALRFLIRDDDGLGASFEGADNTADGLGFTANDDGGEIPDYPDEEFSAIYFWSGSLGHTNTNVGKLTIFIPDDAEVGEYTFTVFADCGVNQAKETVALANSTFTIHVISDEAVPAITGVSVSIGTDLAIAIHTTTPDFDPEGKADYSITAVNPAAKEYITLEGEECSVGAGEYIFYLNVAPWAMDAEFVIDFTDNFEIDELEVLDMSAIPETAKTTGILSYSKALLAKAPSDQLKQLLADLLEYGRQAQIYNGAETPSYSIPAGLTATARKGESGLDFGQYCYGKYTNGQTDGATYTLFSFQEADITFGSRFVATFTVKKDSTKALTLVRITVNDGNGNPLKLTSGKFTYAFSPSEAQSGVVFKLYSASTIKDANLSKTKTYGPAYYAAYLYEHRGDANREGTEDLLALLEAFYNYGGSVRAYVGY